MDVPDISSWGPTLCCDDDLFEADVEEGGSVTIRCCHCGELRATMSFDEYQTMIRWQNSQMEN